MGKLGQNTTEKRKKVFRKCEDVSVEWLEKNWVDNFVQDFKTNSKKAVVLFVNMADDLINESSENVFKSNNFGNTELPADKNYSSETLLKNISSQPLLSAHSISTQSISDLLDPNVCYHPQCSFAYNITGDVKRDSLITQCLPPETYQTLARLWGLDPEKAPRLHGYTCKLQNAEEEDAIVEEYIKNVEKDLGIRSDVSEDLQVNAESLRRSGIKVAHKTEEKVTQFSKFSRLKGDMDIEEMNKSNLREKAKKITKEIIRNFLDWYQSLGGQENESLIDEDTLQELFQIGFDFPAAKALIVRIREMPSIPDSLAILRNEPKHATKYSLRKYLQQDIKQENLPPRMFAFGRMLPKEKPTLRFKPPKNFVKKTWLECSRVPQDLDSMKTVWAGLEKLRSTIAFSNWLKNHPEINPPAYLLKQGLLEINYEEWNQVFKGFEVDMDVLDPVPSKSEKILVKYEKSRLSMPRSRKFDSLESLN